MEKENGKGHVYRFFFFNPSEINKGFMDYYLGGFKRISFSLFFFCVLKS